MKNKKKIIIPIIILVLVVGIILIGFYFKYFNHPSVEIACPASVYCHKLGYEIKMEEVKEGQIGICVFPDKTECEEWSFYEGKCGQNWSYCVVNGYDIETREGGGLQGDPYSRVYSVCVDKNTKQEVGLVFKLINLEESLPSTIIKNKSIE